MRARRNPSVSKRSSLGDCVEKQLIIRLHPKPYARLESLFASGYYGTTIAGTAEELLLKALRQSSLPYELQSRHTLRDMGEGDAAGWW